MAAKDIWKPGVMTLCGWRKMTAIIATEKDRKLSGARSSRIAPKNTAAMMKALCVEILAPERTIYDPVAISATKAAGFCTGIRSASHSQSARPRRRTR